MSLSEAELKERLKKVKMLVTDVDGVMTDGSIFLGVNEELKKYNTLDGAGVKFLIRNNIKVVVITGRESPIVFRRARELGIDEVHQRALKKLPVFEAMLKKYNLSPEEVACVGDDLPDLPLLRHAGVAFAVANATDEVREHAHYVTQARGGEGALREIAELILKAQNKWSQVVNSYLE
ncbi:HAD hydrolase family protein [Candidatus Sumerlaeota bacterium]|nr:HAD hydrolase family protein [Candidatus Sumerlaeota bacterium]